MMALAAVALTLTFALLASDVNESAWTTMIATAGYALFRTVVICAPSRICEST